METILERALSEGTPVIDGEAATFVWQGRRAPQLIGDFTDWEGGSPLTLARIAAGLWAYTLRLPRDAYIEYAYIQGVERLPDPLNPRTLPNGVGATNHFFYMPDAAPTALAQRRRDVPHGLVTSHTVETEGLAVGSKRTVYLYQPPTIEPSPLIIVFDGQDYLRRARLTDIVDNLIAQGRIRPVALAMVSHGGRARLVEYACNEGTVGFILYRVLPLARAQLNLVDVQTLPGAYGLLGASLGGLMALYTALRAPAVFGHVLSQSGAFAFAGHDFILFDLIRDSSVKPLKVWMDVGRFEDLLSANRRLQALLAAKGYAVSYREYNGGHNYTAWRDDVWRGLEALLGV